MKFSIVTPSYNSERYIQETIESVIKQRGDFSIEYFILDNYSTDRTSTIVKEYQDLLETGKAIIGCHDVRLHLISEHDSGMYDAIKNGFARANGDVFAWINSDDIYLPGAFDIIRRTLECCPEIIWLKGITSYINKNSTVYAVGNCHLYRQDWIQEGLYGRSLYFIQQDSVFWRADLWQKSGGVNNQLSLVGVYFLWKSFSQFSPLYSLNAYVSCFRKTDDQKSANINEYWREIDEVSKSKKSQTGKIMRILGCIESLHRYLRPIFYRVVFGRHQHHLVTLENCITPRAWVGEYYELKDKL